MQEDNKGKAPEDRRIGKAEAKRKKNEGKEEENGCNTPKAFYPPNSTRAQKATQTTQTTKTIQTHKKPPITR